MPWSEKKQPAASEVSAVGMDAGASQLDAGSAEQRKSVADPNNHHDFLHKLLLEQPQDTTTATATTATTTTTTSDAHFQHQIMMPVHHHTCSSGESHLQQQQQQHPMTASNGYPIEQVPFGAQSLSFAMGQLQLPSCAEQQAHPHNATSWSSSYSMPIYSSASAAGGGGGGGGYSSQLTTSGPQTDAVALMQATGSELQHQLANQAAASETILQPISDNETIFSSAPSGGFRGRLQHQDSASGSSSRLPPTYTSAIHSQLQELQQQQANIQQLQQQQQQRLSSMFAGSREQQSLIQYQQRPDFLLARGPLMAAPVHFQSQQQQQQQFQPFQQRPLVGPSNGSGGLHARAHYSEQLAPPNRQRKNRSPFFMGGTGNSVLSSAQRTGPSNSNSSSNKPDLFGSTSGKSASSPAADAGSERFSRKVFVGGLPPDIDEEEIKASFRRFGSLLVDWPHKIESKSYFPPKGYAFLLFHEEAAVQALIDACIQENDKLYLSVSSPTIKDKPVQIRPWRLQDSDFVLDSTLALDPRKTVFVGGVPRPLKASELANIMNNFYGGVCYAGIDTDPELKYPKGAGRVAFSNHQSYISAISGRFIHLHLSEIERRVEVKPYVLDDQFCDECQGARCGNKFAPFFCANVACLRYYCQSCWTSVHSQPGKEFHKPLVKEGADRAPRVSAPAPAAAGPTGSHYNRWT